MTDKYFIEPSNGGGFKASKPGAVRASAVASTQGAVIDKIKTSNPDATLHIARVRNVGPGPDKFRKG